MRILCVAFLLLVGYVVPLSIVFAFGGYVAFYTAFLLLMGYVVLYQAFLLLLGYRYVVSLSRGYGRI